MNLLKGGDKKVPKFYFFTGFINNIATKHVTITKITADDNVTICSRGLDLIEQRYIEICSSPNNSTSICIFSNNEVCNK